MVVEASAGAESPHPPHELICFRYLWMRLLLLIISTLFRHADFANVTALDMMWPSCLSS